MIHHFEFVHNLLMDGIIRYFLTLTSFIYCRMNDFCNLLCRLEYGITLLLIQQQKRGHRSDKYIVQLVPLGNLLHERIPHFLSHVSNTCSEPYL